MFTHYVVDAITNGVHAATWAGPAFQRPFDERIPGWRQDNYRLRYALRIPAERIWAAHREQKRTLLQRANEETDTGMDEDTLTLGFARRMTPYKRPDLLFRDINRLKQIVDRCGRLQLVCAGKAHPRDEEGKRQIQHVFQAREALRDRVTIAFLPNYGLELGGMITSGVDVWLNTPEPPLEASGTSGMKAALNAVPSLSILDGWWIEGCVEGLTGWAFGEPALEPQERADGSRDAAELYDKLEKTLLPTFNNHRDRFIEITRHAIAINGSFFNTQRMLSQYVLRACFG